MITSSPNQTAPLQVPPRSPSWGRTLGAGAIRYWWLWGSLTLGGLLLAWWWGQRIPPIYEASFQLWLKDLPQDSNSATQIARLTSPEVLSPLIKNLENQYSTVSYEGWVTQEHPQLQLQSQEQSPVVRVVYRDHGQTQTEAIAQALAKHYLAYSETLQRQTQETQLTRIQRQLPLVGKQVDKLQQDLQKFRQRYNFIDPENQEKALIDRITAVQSQFLQLSANYQSAQVQARNLQSQIGLAPSQVLAADALASNSRYQGLLKDLQTVEGKIAQESARFTDPHPEMQALYQQRQTLLGLLEQEANRTLGSRLSRQISPGSLSQPSPLRSDLTADYFKAVNQIQALGAQMTGLQETAQQLQNQRQQLPALMRQYGDLQRQIALSNQTLTTTLQQRDQLDLSLSQPPSTWEILRPPSVTPRPLNRHPRRDLAVGLVGGLGLGLLVAFMLEKQDRRLRHPGDLSHRLPLPLLAVIPADRSLGLSSAQESIAPLLVNVAPQGAAPIAAVSAPLPQSLGVFRGWAERLTHQGVKSLTIVSPQGGEGKTTLAVHLAKAIASQGQRVLLLDGDLRRGQLHQLLGLPSTPGLRQLLQGQQLPEEAIREVPHFPGLSLLSNGGPGGGLNILDNHQLGQIFEQIQQSNGFDWVICDTPALLTQADAQLLAAYTDGLALVLRCDRSRHDELDQALQRLDTRRVHWVWNEG